MKILLPFTAGLALSVFISSCKKDDNDTSSGDALETVFADSTYQLVGIAKDPTGDMMLLNYPRWSGPYKWGLVKTTGTSAKTPFPDDATNTWLGGQDGREKWVCVQSVTFDRSGGLWVLDPAAPNMGPVQSKSHKLVKVNKHTGAFEKTYAFDSVASDSSYINDVRIDANRQFAYLTNSREGGLVVIDLASGQMRQVLQGHYSVISDPAYHFTIDGKELMRKGMPAKFNSDGIALTPDGEWLYYKPATDDKLYRIRTEYLRDWSMTSTALGSKVEDLGHKCSSDAMIFDDAGNLYLGDMENYRMVKITPSDNHAMTTLVQDTRLIWPDSYAIADGYLYITCSQINKQPDYNDGVNKRVTPYTVYRIKI